MNVSCPNAFGGQPFTDPARLEALLSRLDTIPTEKPIFLKLSPDLTLAEVDALVAVADRHRVHGFISTNLTKVRSSLVIDKVVPTQGGLSGKVVDPLSDVQIAHLYLTTKGRYIIIGVGGIFSADDAFRKIRLGASLVELITGMIFEGPQLIGEVNRGLVRLMDKHGFKNISEAIGTAHQAVP